MSGNQSIVPTVNDVLCGRGTKRSQEGQQDPRREQTVSSGGAIDAMSGNRSIIPTQNDVLCGRGKVCFGNGGNKLLLKLAKEVRAEFFSADMKADFLDRGKKRAKITIKMEIVEKIKARGGRFLKMETKTNNKVVEPKGKETSEEEKTTEKWIELTDKEAREIVKNAFRRAKAHHQSHLKTKKRRKQAPTSNALAAGGHHRRSHNQAGSTANVDASLRRSQVLKNEAAQRAPNHEYFRFTSAGTVPGIHALRRSQPLLPQAPGTLAQGGYNPMSDGFQIRQNETETLLRRPSIGDLPRKLGFSTCEDRSVFQAPPGHMDSTMYPFINPPTHITRTGFNAKTPGCAADVIETCLDWPKKDLECAIDLLAGPDPSDVERHVCGREKGEGRPVGPATDRIFGSEAPDSERHVSGRKKGPRKSSLGPVAANTTSPALLANFSGRRGSFGLCPPDTPRRPDRFVPLALDSHFDTQASARTSESLPVSLDWGSGRGLEPPGSSSDRGLDAASIHSFSQSTIADSIRDDAEEQTSFSRLEEPPEMRNDGAEGISGSGIFNFNAVPNNSEPLQDNLHGIDGFGIISESDAAEKFDPLFPIDYSDPIIRVDEINASDSEGRADAVPARARGQGEDGRGSDTGNDIQHRKAPGNLGAATLGLVSVVALVGILVPAVLLGTKGEMDKESGGRGARKLFLTNIIQERSPSTSFENASSPQAKALDWMLNDSYTTALSDEDGLLQRFGLATLRYSTGEWDSIPPWLTSANECSHWNGTSSDDGIGLSCNKKDVVDYLSLGGDAVRGTIPPEILFLSNLLVLELIDNNLEGTLPTTIGELSVLVDLTIKSTNIGGTMPSEMGLMTSLESVDLRDNNFEGTIPTYLGWWERLTNLALGHNLLSGVIPSELGWLDLLEIVDLSGNKLEGTIPESLGQLVNLAGLILFNNALTGKIPSELGLLTLQKVVDISPNQLDGTIPSTVGQWENRAGLLLGNNSLIGEIPSELGLLGSLEVVDLGSNELSGSIPTTVGHLTNVVSLALDHNLLTGRIPSEVGLLTNLRRLDLSENDLGGIIPTTLGHLVNLTTLLLGNNSLTGAIPTELTTGALRWFDLCGNNFRPRDIFLWILDWLRSAPGGSTTGCSSS